MAQTVTAAQLRAVVDRAVNRRDDQQLVLVQGVATTELTTVAVGEASAEVHATNSPLAIRRFARQAADTDSPIVVITDLSHAELGDDLIMRAAGRKVWTPNRDEALKAIFGARIIARDLSRKRALMDALIEAQPPNGYPPMRGTTLDAQGALGALLKAQLGLSDAVNSLDRFLGWLDATPQGTSRVLAAGAAVNTEESADFDEHLAMRFGQGVRPVLAILRSDHPDDLIPMLLVADVVHHLHQVHESRGIYELELETNRVPLEPEWWRLAGQAALDMASPEVLHDDARRRAWSNAASERLERYQQPELAERSIAIEAGFDMRLATVGRQLQEARQAPSNGALVGSVENALAAAREHSFADQVRVERAHMAWRLIRRGTGSVEWGSRLSSLGAAYQRDGAWVDRARNAIARGDSVPELATLYADLGAAFSDARQVDNREFAQIAQSAAKPLPDDVIGVEDVMRLIVAPVAAEAPVLVLVFDGMGYESFTEVARLMDDAGFAPYLDPTGVVARPCYAALPTVTEVSRTSLFAGTLRDGNQASEGRAFAALRELVDVSSSKKPPLIHHKVSLRGGGIDSTPDDAMADIKDTDQRVVAVVLNNIDERLKDVAGPVSNWGFDELHPLSWLLSAAREVDRAVVITSDHGHVLDRDAEQRRVTGAKERWRTADIEPADDEILVEGPRVVTPDQRAVLPFVEQLHYDARRNGYHGGICPQEILVPVAVYATKGEVLPDWSRHAFGEPDWWRGIERSDDGTAALGAVPPAPVVRPKPPKGVDPDAPTLFEDVPEPVVAQPVALADSQSWVEQVLPRLAQHRRPQVRLTDDDVRVLLGALENLGTEAMPMERLAATTSLPPNRVGRYVSQLQSIVNIDGYSILSVTGTDVRFDKDLLETQLSDD